jgi:hypothetical protein
MKKYAYTNLLDENGEKTERIEGSSIEEFSKKFSVNGWRYAFGAGTCAGC